MKIICVGRNYHDHISELKNKTPKEPLLFIKPDSALLIKGQPFFIPDFTENVHHEIELVVRINRLGKNIAEKYAHKYYNQISVGLDFTARDKQSQLKEDGHPWEKAKAFDGSAVLGKLVDLEKGTDIGQLNFHLTVNGETLQQGNTSDMIFHVNQLIAEASKYFTLKIGDLIFTGTPKGVGQVKAGDELKGYLEDQELFKVKIR